MAWESDSEDESLASAEGESLSSSQEEESKSGGRSKSRESCQNGSEERGNGESVKGQKFMFINSLTK